MGLRALIVALVWLCASPASVLAQAAGFRVEAESASIHLSPSTGSLVIGHARRGMVLEVTRDLGSWVKVAWPEAKDGAGYVHVSTGSRSTGVGWTAQEPSTPLSTARGPGSRDSRIQTAQGTSASGEPSTRPAASTYVAPPTHLVGVGARFGDSTVGSGASLRAWPVNPFGVQFEVTRSSLTSGIGTDRLTSVQFAPSVLYALPDGVTDYVWIRPYAGAGPRFVRQSLRGAAQPEGASISETRLGFQLFGGAEVTFASLPGLAVSAGLHYGWLRNPNAGFELGGLGASVSGHWYVK